MTIQSTTLDFRLVVGPTSLGRVLSAAQFQAAVGQGGSACFDDLRGRSVRRDNVGLKISQVCELGVHGFGQLKSRNLTMSQ